MTGRKRSHSNSNRLTDKWGAGGDNVTTRQLLLRHVWELYRHDVVAGSKACIAGYSAVQAYITAVWASCMSGERGEGRWERGRRENEGEKN